MQCNELISLYYLILSLLLVLKQNKNKKQKLNNMDKIRNFKILGLKLKF